MHVAIVADPQVNRLLPPADDTVQLALQIEHQTIDKIQIVARHGRILDTQQVCLQLIARRVQGILQFPQGAGTFPTAVRSWRSPRASLCAAAGRYHL